jgi:hypothetical protein
MSAEPSTGATPAATTPVATTPVADLHGELAALIDEAQALRTDVRSAEQARRRASQINLGVLILLIIFVGLLMAVTWQNNRLSHEVAKGNARIADCTTAGGKCYDDGKKRTGSAIGDIIRAEIFMAECARQWPGESGPTFDRKLEACVAQRLTNANATPAPTPSG